jgi:hypothetical protein
MGRNVILITVPAVLLMGFLSADASIRCGTKLIEDGDSALKLLQACGKPMAGNPDLLEDGEWTYNFGPDQFLVKVIIRNSRVERTEILGKGFTPQQNPSEEEPP